MVQRIYTRTGDAGETALFGGGRVLKTHPRVEAYGEVDELNAVLGWAAEACSDGWVRDTVSAIQPDLFAIGAHLATPPPPPRRRAPALPPLPDSRIPELEAAIDKAEDGLPELRAFIMPGGSPGGAALHVARTVCRRAERRVVDLAAHERIAPSILVYLNRLSDLLFVLARAENQRAGVAEQVWQP